MWFLTNTWFIELLPSFAHNAVDYWLFWLFSGNLVVATGKCMSPTKYLQLFQISWGTTQANNVTKLLEDVLVNVCGEKEKADGGDSLACDSCEEIYHLSCVEPTVKEIPVRSWYCAKGMESPHDNCVVCERLTTSSSVIIEDEVEDLTSEDMVLELEDSTNGLVDGELKLCEGVEDSPCCNVCTTEGRHGRKM
ncbi:hypothetical protein MTR67_019869, partial [Solanum verrucosum]